MAKRRVKRKYTKKQTVASKLQDDGVILNPAIAEPNSDTDGSAGAKEPAGEVSDEEEFFDDDEEEEQKGTLEGYVPKKTIYECPFCSSTQDELLSSDPTTGWCKQCGRAFPSNCIKVG